MSATELFDGARAGSTDVSGRHERQRFFLVTAPPDAALLEPTLPALGSGYPASNALKLDRFDVAHTADGSQSIVTANYTNNRSARLPPRIDDSLPNFKSWSVDISTQERVIPSVWESFITPVGAAGGSGYTAQYEVDEKLKVFENVVVYQREVTLTSLDAQVIAAIVAQNNAIHVIEGRPLLYKAAPIIPSEGTRTAGFNAEPEVWTTVHTWFADPGTPEIKVTMEDEPGSPTAQRVPAPNPRPFPIGGQPPDVTYWWWPKAHLNGLNVLIPNFNDTAMYARSPFHIIVPQISALDPDIGRADVQFDELLPFRIDPNGYQSLPGNPI